jgi:hypothetical protein
LRPLYVASDSLLGSLFALELGGQDSILNEAIFNPHVKIVSAGRKI